MKFFDKIKDTKLLKKIAIIGAIMFGIGAFGTGITFAVIGEKIIETESGSNTYTGDVSSIIMTLYIENVVIKAEDRDDVLVEYQAIPKDYIPVVSTEEGTLQIKQRKKFKVGVDFRFMGFLRNGFQNSEIRISVPQKLYDNIEIRSDLGETEVIDLQSNDLIVKTGMGKSDITASADSVRIEAGMGEVIFNSTKEGGKKIVCDTGMGNVTVNNADFAQYDFSTSMGNLNINGLTGTGKINTDMGETKVRFAKWNGDMDVSASMCDVEIYLPKGSGAVVDASVDMGSIEVRLAGMDIKSFSGTTSFHGDGMHKLEIKANMGNVNISD